MFTLTTSLPDEKWCAELLRKVRWNGHVTCPYCNSGNVKKDGRYMSYQKYRCKCCKKWFNDKTGTVFHYSHTPLKTWFLVMYLLFVLWPGCSTREAALEIGVPYARCYRFVRTVMERMISSFPSPKLDGTVESDEFYIKAGLKGRPYHGEISRSGRKPRKRGLKPWRGRGTFEKEQPTIACIHERGGMTLFDVPVKQPLVDVVCGSVSYGSTVYTDEYRAYDQLKGHGFVHECVSHSGKEYARGDVHVNNCECRSNLCQLWLKKFMGVNRHNLQAYVKSFQFVHNLRNRTREERFRLILCYNQLKHS